MTINVLFLAAEAEPFIKVGGLGDVAGALPGAIQQTSRSMPENPEMDIRLVLPYHYAIKQRNLETVYMGEFEVQKVGGIEKCQVYRYDRGETPVYLLDGLPIDERSPVYSTDPVLDGYKFVFFSLACLKLADFLDWQVDILHANDWHTATAIYALSLESFRTANLRNTRSIHTLHNLPFMGFGVQQALTNYGIPPIEDPILPDWARHAPLPMGLYAADRIVAVSPHYAEEVLTPAFGCGLEQFLKTRKNHLMGILNGLDIRKWDPETDPFIKERYDVSELPLRKKNKQDLQEQVGLPQEESVPLVTIISRMDPQKGIDIALNGLRHCTDSPWQAVILGTGIPYVEEMALDLEREFPDQVRTVIDFDNELAHQLYAGADILMMPSRYEPCGLSQIIAMRYGCVPVARATGGLVDTINHISRRVDSGTGFLFSRPYPSVFANVLKRAFRYYQHPESWHQIQRNDMQTNFSWVQSARKYIAVYEDLMSE
jgi:starch synthase